MTDSASLNRIFTVLSNQRRRYVLYYLDAAETNVTTLDALADQLADWERRWEAHDEAGTADHRERLSIALHHNHLPRLAEAGLIDYDARTQTIRNCEVPSIYLWAKAAEAELKRLQTLFTPNGE